MAILKKDKGWHNANEPTFWEKTKENLREGFSADHKITQEDLEAATNMAMGSAGVLSKVGAAPDAMAKAAGFIINKARPYVGPVINKAKGLLRNAYKVNPLAGKVPTTPMYRIERSNAPQLLPTLEGMEAKRLEGTISQYQEYMIDDSPSRASIKPRDTHYRQWYTNNPKGLQYYIDDNPGPKNLLRTVVRNSDLPQYNVGTGPYPDAQKISNIWNEEFILPKGETLEAKVFDSEKLPELIKQHRTEPHWLKGYEKPTGENMPYKRLYRVDNPNIPFKASQTANGGAQAKFAGQWFIDDPKELASYASKYAKLSKDTPGMRFSSVEVPMKDLPKYNVKNIPEMQGMDVEPNNWAIPESLPRIHRPVADPSRFVNQFNNAKIIDRIFGGL
jgi:hypothetical protein